MFDAVMKPVMFSGDRMFVWLCFLLASTIILAENGSQIELPTMYDEIISEEIYQSAGAWRESKPIENDWRAPPPKREKQGRINLGFDAETSYREMGDLPRNDYYAPKQNGLSERKPTNTIFRLDF